MFIFDVDTHASNRRAERIAIYDSVISRAIQNYFEALCELQFSLPPQHHYMERPPCSGVASRYGRLGPDEAPSRGVKSLCVVVLLCTMASYTRGSGVAYCLSEASGKAELSKFG